MGDVPVCKGFHFFICFALIEFRASLWQETGCAKWRQNCWFRIYFELEISNDVIISFVWHIATNIHQGRCGPAVTWAEIDWFELASLVRYTYDVSPAVTWAESDVIWIVIWCQTVVLSIEGSVMRPPHVRPFLVIWVFFSLGKFHVSRLSADIEVLNCLTD